MKAIINKSPMQNKNGQNENKSTIHIEQLQDIA